MSEDRSLDDFAPDSDADESAAAGSDDAEGEADAADLDDAEGEADAADPDEAEGGAADAAVPVDTADVDPAVATSTWHADGAECDRCGERVERRWRDEDAFVCADCASW